MSQIQAPPKRRRRADAERSIAAILDGAMDLLGERPDASMEDIAKAAGVTRQTVYAHYTSRDALIRAVRERAMAETVAALDAADLGRGSPTEALDRLVGASWRTLERYPILMGLRAGMTAQELHDFHRPILDRLGQLIRRGQRAGVFDRRQPPGWLLAAFLGLSHAAADEVAAQRIDAEDAARALGDAVPRIFGVECRQHHAAFGAAQEESPG